LIADTEITRLAGVANSDINKAYVDTQDLTKVDKVSGKV
jgi:hypothetical protein